MSTLSDVYWGVHSALNSSKGAVNPLLLLLGDSWLWYPKGNIARSLNTQIDRDLVVIGNNGAEAQEWATKYRKAIEFGFKMYASNVQGLLLSGGGNDIAGSTDFLRLLKDDCSKATTVQECYREGQPETIVAGIVGAYRQVILNFRAYNATAPVFTHNYDYPWATGKGLLGPSKWLKVPMDKAKVKKDDQFRHDLLIDLLDKLRKAQLALGREAGIGKLVAIKSAGTLPEDPGQKGTWWDNELHPTPAGFDLLVKDSFARTIKKELAI